MRDIKFRAWDANGRDWFHFSLTSTHVNIPAVAKDGMVQQYTGLKDKNGVEIYEGDIYTVYSEMNGENVGKYEVKWGHSGFGLPDEQWIELIGNIYENPGLLNA